MEDWSVDSDQLRAAGELARALLLADEKKRTEPSPPVEQARESEKKRPEDGGKIRRPRLPSTRKRLALPASASAPMPRRILARAPSRVPMSAASPAPIRPVRKCQSPRCSNRVAKPDMCEVRMCATCIGYAFCSRPACLNRVEDGRTRCMECLWGFFAPQFAHVPSYRPGVLSCAAELVIYAPSETMNADDDSVQHRNAIDRERETLKKELAIRAGVLRGTHDPDQIKPIRPPSFFPSPRARQE